MQNPSSPNSNASPVSQAVGCLSPAILLLLFIWMLSAAVGLAVVLGFARVAGSQVPDRMVAGYNLLVALPLALPLVPLALLWKEPRYRAIFQTWLLGLLFLLLLAPVGLLPATSAQAQALLRAVLSVVYISILGIIAFLQRRKKLRAGTQPEAGAPFSSGSLLLGITCGLLLALPWLAWGALGSLLDTGLQVLAGLAMGLSAALTFELFLFPAMRRSSISLLRDFLLTGFAASAWLLLLAAATAFPYWTMQWILMLYLPALGWLVAGLARMRGGSTRLLTGALPAAALLGLVLAAPFAWIDADELYLLVSMSAGEILSWAFRAAGASLLLGFCLGTPLGALLANRAARPPRQGEPVPGGTSRTLLAVALTGLVAAGILSASVYSFAGQPGFYGEGLFVILKDQADLSQAPGMTDTTARRSYVYITLVTHANSTQAGLRAEFERRGLAYTPYYLVNAIQVNGGPLLKLWLQSRPEVDRVLDNPWLRPLPEKPPVQPGPLTSPQAAPWNLTLIGADRVVSELDVTGAGILVGQSDSGMQGDHPEFAQRYRGYNADGSLSNDYNWLDPWYHTRQPTDLGGHGTHTLGTILGQHTGVAPGAQWIGCVNLARNLGNPALYLDCMQFMLAPFPMDGNPLTDGDPARGAQVLNNSWGCPDIEGCDPEALVSAVSALRAAGVFVVASAGNDGPPCSSLKDPIALYQDAFTVGAIDASKALADFSSRGPVTADGSNRIKPDIVAPGVDVISSTPNNTYATFSGTSMAGPHVVGVVALIWSANPALIGDIERTEQILRETAQPYTGPLPNCPGAANPPSAGGSTAVGDGIVDAYEAVQAALALKP